MSSFVEDFVHVVYGFLSGLLSFLNPLLTLTNTFIYLFYQYVEYEEYCFKKSDIVEYTSGLIAGEFLVFLVKLI